MGLKLIMAPTTEPLTLELVKTHLRIDHNAEDVVIQSHITGARLYCERYQNRSLIPQTWELWLDTWPARSVELPLPPLASLQFIKYYDQDGTEHTVDPATYIVDDKGIVGRVVLKNGCTWPTGRLQSANAVVIRFTAGYAEGQVPETVKQAMILHVKLAYDDYTPQDRERMEKARDSLLTFERITPV